MKPWYEQLFANYAAQYDKESFTEGTLGECDFIESELAANKSLQILDVGCGTGRHAIELTKRGYGVSGIDLSEAQLQKAREKAAAAGLEIPFLRHDARQLPFADQFDAVIMLCEGGFPLMETDWMNFAILQNAEKALRSGGKLIFTTLNGLFAVFHPLEDFPDKQSAGEDRYPQRSFDLMTMREHSRMKFVDDDGLQHEILCNERYYMPSEITWLLQSLGFRKSDIYGAELGAFSREQALTKDHFEMLVIAEK